MINLKEKLNRNLALKAISVALAFIIWLLVVNISQPEVTGSQSVELQVRNADRLTSADKTYTLDTRTVRVNYRVRLPRQSSVSASDFTAYVDLADYSITGAVPVYIEVSDKASDMISDVSLSPMVVHVATEDIQRKRFDVSTATLGRTTDGYMAGEVSIDPDYVYVTGPVSEVGQISELGIEIDVTDKNSALSGSAPIQFYDANGNQIQVDDRISLTPSEITYELPIYRIKSLSVVAGASGVPAEGYVLDSVDTNPAFIDVYGDEAVLSQYSSIRIPDAEISVNGASMTVTRSIDITQYLPEGLRAAQPGTEVAVAAKIRKIPETTESTAESEQDVSLSQTEGTGESETERRETEAESGENETGQSSLETADPAEDEHGTRENTEQGSAAHTAAHETRAAERLSRESQRESGGAHTQS